MKKITFFLVMALLTSIPTMAQYETCGADANQIYYTTNAGWTQSEWYPIINIDAEKLTVAETGLAAHSGADGTATSATHTTGVFRTPVYNVDGAMNPVPTSVLWPVFYYMACLAPNYYTSAYTKIEINGAASWSGKGNTCYDNNNSIKQSPIWTKKGFIELSRMAAATEAPTVSRHGYVMLTDLPQVERVQYSFSSTGWKRGFKLDIKHNNGEWQPLQWEASDISNGLAGFAEQGYGFEVLINKQEDPTSKISLRWTIWNGDTIHENVTKTDGSKYSTTHTPLAQKQVVRIHQIKIFSGIVPTVAPNAIANNHLNTVKIHLTGSNIVLSEVCNVDIYTIEGKKLYNGNTDRVNVVAFSKGIYIIRAIDIHGKVQNVKISI